MGRRGSRNHCESVEPRKRVDQTRRFGQPATGQHSLYYVQLCGIELWQNVCFISLSQILDATAFRTFATKQIRSTTPQLSNTGLGISAPLPREASFTSSLWRQQKQPSSQPSSSHLPPSRPSSLSKHSRPSSPAHNSHPPKYGRSIVISNTNAHASQTQSHRI